MPREEADIKAREIVREADKVEAEIEAEARRNGTWLEGLDANSHLFRELHKKTPEKVQAIFAQADE